MRVKKAAKEPKLSQEKRSRLRIKTKKDKAKPKVKIFLEYPDEIEQFETGICATDVKDEKQLADDNEMNDFKFQTPQKTPLAARHISPLVSLRMPPPQNRIFFSPQKYYSHSPYQTPGNDSRMNLNPHFNQQYQVQNYRRFR